MRYYAQSEIDNLEKKERKIKIGYLEGYLVKTKDFSSNIDTHYGKKSGVRKLRYKGLNFQWYFSSPENALYIFTKCPFDPADDEIQIEAKRDSILLTIFTSPQDFMWSNLGRHYREYIMEIDGTWDKFGYFRTECKKYNRLPIMTAIRRLEPDQVVRDQMPPKRRCILEGW